MSAMHARAARRERQTAKVLGTERVRRKRGERAPDIRPIELPNGARLQAEVKSRKRLPALVTAALRQATGYTPDAIPLVAIYEKGARDGVACVPLSRFAALVGLDIEALPKPTPLRRPRAKPKADGQLTFFDLLENHEP